MVPANMQPAKTQASLRICADSHEASLLACTEYGRGGSAVAQW